jgi:hypothetical protein
MAEFPLEFIEPHLILWLAANINDRAIRGGSFERKYPGSKET